MNGYRLDTRSAGCLAELMHRIKPERWATYGDAYKPGAHLIIFGKDISK